MRHATALNARTAFKALLGAMLLAAAALLAVHPAFADVYRSVDAQGRVQYSDTPSPGAQRISLHDARSAPAVPPARSKPTASAPQQEAVRQSAAQQQAASQSAAASKQALDTDLAQTRAEQCKKAQDAYQQALISRRIYKTDENGERDYLSAEDADQLRLKARMEMDSVCKGDQ